MTTEAYVQTKEMTFESMSMEYRRGLPTRESEWAAEPARGTVSEATILTPRIEIIA